jgi:hypothetical protein
MEMLDAAGMNERTSDITGLLWGKLLVNAAMNPLTALLDVPNGRLLELPKCARSDAPPGSGDRECGGALNPTALCLHPCRASKKCCV